MKRYERQIILPEIGITGQQKLAEARIIIIGVGGLGCPVLQNLAAAGVGKIGIVDGDVVEETNLHRQYLYTLSHCGKNKVDVARSVVSKQNPNVEVIQYSKYLDKENCFDIIANYQIIVDCTDSIATRYLINDVSVDKAIPMVYASIHKFEGQLSVFNYQNGPSYRCLFPEDERLETIQKCDDSGVLGVLPSVLGAMQANEVLKIILEIGEVLSGNLLIYNSLNNCFQTIEIQKNTNSKNKIKINSKSISEIDLFSDNNSLIIDIREEYEEPKLDLEKIKNVPLSELDNFLSDVDKTKKIILLCQNGTRSELATEYLTKKGFANVYHLQNGINKLQSIHLLQK